MGMYWKPEVCPVLGNGQKKLAGIWKMAEVEIPSNAVLVGHEHLPNPCPNWNRGHELQYHTNVKPEGADFEDAVGAAYGAFPGR